MNKTHHTKSPASMPSHTPHTPGTHRPPHRGVSLGEHIRRPHTDHWVSGPCSGRVRAHIELTPHSRCPGSLRTPVVMRFPSLSHDTDAVSVSRNFK
eukprot:4655176-Prymnesium_polylepis.1